MEEEIMINKYISDFEAWVTGKDLNKDKTAIIGDFLKGKGCK